MDAIRYAKNISDFIWNGVRTPSPQEYEVIMKIIIPSTMLQLGLFATKDGKAINFTTRLPDKSLGSFKIGVTGIGHSESTNELIVYGDLHNREHPTEDRRYEIRYSGSKEGKEALSKDFYFYHLNSDEQVPGMTKEISD